MTVKQLEKDETILVENIENPQDFLWTAYEGKDNHTFDDWLGAYEFLSDQVRYWYGYYSEQLKDSEEMGLAYTSATYTGYCFQYEKWIEYLESIEDKPQQVHLIGSHRKLAIAARKKSKND